MFPGQHPTCGKNVLSSGSPYRAGDSVVGKPVPEAFHNDLRSRLERSVRNLVEADQVDPALQSAKQPDKRVGVTLVIVQAGEHSIFKAHSALACEVIFTDHLDHFLHRPRLLHRHHLRPFVRERVVEADGEVAAGGFEVFPQVRKDSDGRKGDTLRAPAESPVGGQHLDRPHHIAEVVQRLAHSHKDGVRQLRGLVDGDELGKDVRHCEVAMESLPSCHAELAAHPAAGLRGDTEGLSVVIGNHHRLDGIALPHREKVFLRAVRRDLAGRRQGHAEGIFLLQPFASGFRDVGHLVDAPDLPAVHPLSDLLAGKGRQTDFQSYILQFDRSLTKQLLTHIPRVYFPTTNLMKNNAGLDVILYLCHKGDIFSPKNNKQHYFNIMAKEVEAKATDAGAAKLKALQATIDKIEKDYGKGTIMKLGEQPQWDVQVIPSGSVALDHALGIGGYPRGRIVEIYGPESSGKTTLAIHAIAEAQKQGGIAAMIDAEHAFDRTYAKALGVNLETLLISQPDNGEQALEIADNLIRSGAIDIVVVDSVAALTPKAEIEGEMGDNKVGLQARLMSQALRKLTANISKTNTCCIFINQLREKIGVMFGNPETTTGGNALKFYASVRIDVRKTTQLKDGDEALGNRTRVKVVKNKMAPPFKKAEFDIVFGEGISHAGEILDLGVEYGIVGKSGSWFSYGDQKLAQGREATKQLLKDNQELCDEIEAKVREALKNVKD